MTATIQQNKSDADGKITKAQTTATQALDGLSTKVEKTEYNQKTGELSSKINETSDTAEQSKQDIIDIKETDSKQDNRMLEIEKNAEGIKQTVSDLSTEQGKQSGYISTLQQRADGFEATVTKVNNLAVGGRNYILNSKRTLDSKVSTSDAGWVDTSIPISMFSNTVFTMSIQVDYDNVTAVTGANRAGIELVAVEVKPDGSNASRYFGVWRNAKVGESFHGRISATFDMRGANLKSVYAPNHWVQGMYLQGITATNLSVSNPKIEIGNSATDWTPAPEDLSGATAKAQLTADQATTSLNNYKSDADGRINKAQADIRANAEAISTKVAKTDYDKKTGELTTSVNRAQQTADTATQTIGTYKESNDRRVQAAETNIHTNSEAIKATISKTDFDRATGELSGDISTLQQRADGFDATVTKVNNLAVGGRNLYITATQVAGYVTADNGRIFGQTSFKEMSSNYIAVLPNTTYTFQAWGSLLSGQQYWSVVGQYGSDKSFISRLGGLYGVSPVTTDVPNDYEKRVFTTSANTYFVRVSSRTFGNYKVKFEKGNIPTDWTPAPEDVDTQLAQVKLTADGVYQTVNNPQTGLNTRVSTAEGNITKVQGAVGSMSTTVTQTADGLTREIADRKNGDQAVRTDMATLINQQVTSVTNGYQSVITQTADGIIQQVGNLKIRYVRFASDGNTTNTGNHYQEFALYATNGANLLDGKVATTTGYTVPSQYQIASLTDGNKATTAQIGDGAMSEQGRWAFFDIGSLVNPDYVAITPYYQDGRRHQNVVVQVSADNQYWRTIYQGAIQTVAGDVARSTVRVPVNGSSFTSFMGMFQDNWAIGIKDNAGNLINGINSDPSGMTIAAKKLTVSADTTFLGTNWLNGAVIKDASISNAQIADASITSAKIVNLDVNKITGEVANFIRAYWDGQYGSTSITSEGMTVSAGVTTTVFDENGMQLNKSNRSVGRIGVNELYQDFSKKGLYFGLESTGDFMAWGAQNYAGNPYSTKLSWFRAGAVPSNLPGLIEGFNFEDNVAFINPVEMRGGIKLQGANDRLLVRASNLNGGSYPTFGGPSAYFVYAGSDIYLSSNGTAINLTKIAKAFGGIRTAAIPTGFNSNGTATGWYNVDMG
ncbi:hypothetical protein [Weissella confusa]|uniref:hypothetical protein n=1 Tax=Weissella confusa TaxID=1583 RepID=UPI00107F5B79|nr:hypothetical protein [Weissella confusa]QBZ02798.1 hypothetical protein C6P13_05855 [Weissella confusa]TGE60255.1 hypothetical protein C6P16_05885 [Weissella confusa]TGE68423.1 hypothetical protein C6P14_05885 [Weissella confusa]